MNRTKESLGSQIRKARKLKGMNQTELANKLKVTRQTIAAWENDVSEPRYAYYLKLSKLLDLDLL